jgi:hypothetical protein
MSAPTQVHIDPANPVAIDVAPGSPHVFRYKMWVKAAGAATWKFLGKGTTVDAAPDRLDLGQLQPGSRLQYWLGIGGKAGMPYRADFRVEQGGNPIPDGKWSEEGPLDRKSVTATVAIVEFV